MKFKLRFLLHCLLRRLHSAREVKLFFGGTAVSAGADDVAVMFIRCNSLAR